MGFVKGIFCKIHHILINLSCHFRRNSFGNTSGYRLFFITIYEVLSLFLHDVLLFLTHGTSYQITSSQRISAQIPYDLHYLLLVHNTSVGRRQNRLQLRTQIGDGIITVLTFDILRDKVHGPRTIQRNSCNDIFQVLRLKLLHKAFHTGTFQLEHTFCPACSDRIQYLFILIINVKHIQLHTIIFFHQTTGILNHSKGTESQKVHLQKPQFLNGSHGKLGGDRPILRPG